MILTKTRFPQETLTVKNNEYNDINYIKVTYEKDEKLKTTTPYNN